ncbi:diphthamide synthesis protein [Candidatus Woesearchaeota archaeon]|nr:diphthamide synthesis protein [Candidatus Woesearchaeota archaeon]
MKILNLHAKALVDIQLPEIEIKKLPSKIGLVATIQHLDKIKEIQNQLPQSIIGGQVLGCNTKSAEKIINQVDAFLFIGSGQFHPIAIALKTKKPVFCWNPFTKESKEVEKKDIESYEKKNKASLTKFLSSNKIGILVSTKPGQYNMDKALKLKKENKRNKEYYIFQFDTLNPIELENFPFIECWVNTACPRIADEKVNIINIQDLPEF